MENTQRTQTKTTSKYYETMNHNDWTLKFEYETENQELSGKINVTGQKNTSSIFASKENSQLQTIFSNGEYDAEIVAVIMTEFNAIVSQHTST